MSSCSHLSGYENVDNPATIRPTATLNGGCYPVKEKEMYCSDASYKLIGNDCVRTVVPKTK